MYTINRLLLRILSAGFTFITVIKCGFCTDEFTPKIAIIGSGIGGASAAHFLTELFDQHLEIDIFETNEVGGRLATVELKGKSYEAGGSIIHSRNRYMNDFAQLLGIEQRPTPDGLRTGIWNGNEFVFKEDTWEILTYMNLVWRYGLQPFKLYRYVNSVLDKFENIYTLQDNGEAYEDVDELLSAMNSDFPKLREISMVDHLHSLGFSENLINELVEATLLTNYGQDTNVHSFVGCVSVAGAGAGLWSVKGGNKEVPAHLIYRNSQVNLVPSQVTEIRYIVRNDSVPEYEISYSNPESADVMNNAYDVVIVATPLTKDQKFQIKFTDFPKNDTLKFLGDYQTTIATFVDGIVNMYYFGLDESLDGILSCNANRTKINGIGKIFPVEGQTENNSRVWKIFSKEPLKLEQINSMFSEVNEVESIAWKAYPKYATNQRLDRFKLYDSLYHINAIEWAASAMEMSAIGGRNVALLIHKEFTSCCGNMEAGSTSMRIKRCAYVCNKNKLPPKRRNVEL